MQDALNRLPTELWYLILNGSARGVPFLDPRYRVYARRVCRAWNALLSDAAPSDAVPINAIRPTAASADSWVSSKVLCASTLVDRILALDPWDDRDAVAAILAQAAPIHGWTATIPRSNNVDQHRRPIADLYQTPRSDPTSPVTRRRASSAAQHLFDCAIEMVRLDRPDEVLPLAYLALHSLAPVERGTFCRDPPLAGVPFGACERAAVTLWCRAFASGAVRVAAAFMDWTSGKLHAESAEFDSWGNLVNMLGMVWVIGTWGESACQGPNLDVFDTCAHRFFAYLRPVREAAHYGDLSLLRRLAATKWSRMDADHVAAHAIHGRGSRDAIDSIVAWLADEHGYVIQRVDGLPVAEKPCYP
ncbi:F-box domain containing protein [Pandoravirus macleodensis]|uniref:F-box domain containing protein n=1 Tax=Pandoravirus macleodensis TaxID=2107707 RepID=A0A2U7UFJ1_9VIRU|nr:F-box domain containing protein [Pandoravirus macleodensis]AVK77216.1 F-box domain containing protein [Pandoravirus macleodensis]